MLHHPHLHCLVPAGGLSLDRSRWIHCRKRFFLPVRVLGAEVSEPVPEVHSRAITARRRLRLLGKLSGSQPTGSISISSITR